MKKYRSIVQDSLPDGYPTCHFMPYPNLVLTDAIASSVILSINSHHKPDTVIDYGLWRMGLLEKKSQIHLKLSPRQSTIAGKHLLKLFDAESRDTSIETAIRLMSHEQGFGQHRKSLNHSVLQTFLNQSTRVRLCPLFQGMLRTDPFRYLYLYCHNPQQLF